MQSAPQNTAFAEWTVLVKQRQAQVGTYQKTITAQKTKMVTLEKRANRLDQRIDGLLQTIATQKIKITDLERSATEICQHKHCQEEVSKTSDELRRRIDNYEEAISELKDFQAISRDATLCQMLAEYRNKLLEQAPPELTTTTEKILHLRNSELDPLDEWVLDEYEVVSERSRVAVMRDAVLHS